MAHVRFPLIAPFDIMNLVKPTGLVSKDKLLEAVAFQADPKCINRQSTVSFKTRKIDHFRVSRKEINESKLEQTSIPVVEPQTKCYGTTFDSKRSCLWAIYGTQEHPTKITRVNFADNSKLSVDLPNDSRHELSFVLDEYSGFIYFLNSFDVNFFRLRISNLKYEKLKHLPSKCCKESLIFQNGKLWTTTNDTEGSDLKCLIYFDIEHNKWEYTSLKICSISKLFADPLDENRIIIYDKDRFVNYSIHLDSAYEMCPTEFMFFFHSPIILPLTMSKYRYCMIYTREHNTAWFVVYFDEHESSKHYTLDWPELQRGNHVFPTLDCNLRRLFFHFVSDTHWRCMQF